VSPGAFIAYESALLLKNDICLLAATDREIIILAFSLTPAIEAVIDRDSLESLDPRS
jgi:hypothetical protein